MNFRRLHILKSVHGFSYKHFNLAISWKVILGLARNINLSVTIPYSIYVPLHVNRKPDPYFCPKKKEECPY